MREAIICEPLRTAVGRYGGVFRNVNAATLGSTVLKELFRRTGIEPKIIDDVIVGQCFPNGEAPAIGRVIALDSELPVSVPGFQIDRRCGSGLQAVIVAAMQVQTGVSDIVIAGGVESMSQAEYYSTSVRWGARSGSTALLDRLERGRITAGGMNHLLPGGMIETAENLRREYGISRRDQDELAVVSHERAVLAQRGGLFDEEIVGVELDGRDGTKLVTMDEHPRPTTTLEALARLDPILKSTDPESTVTAGNSSGQNDAAALCIVTHPALAAELGLAPLVRLRSWGVAGVEPERMGLGPIPATAKALERAGLSLSDMDLIELNEAFASQVLACIREWGFTPKDLERLNVNGSGISLGHPVGATGCRILVSLSREMKRRGAPFGLETMCIGGGQGIAAVFETIG